MTKRLGLDIPALVEFPPETKTMVIGAIKLILRRMHKAGLLARDMSYGELLGDAMLLHEVIGLYKAHRDLSADLVVSRKGEPAAGDQAELVCGITLAQVERLLVFTCAKRLFAGADRAWEGTRPTGVVVPEELKRILAFDWQLPLLPLYRDFMTAEHFRVLGDAALALRTPRMVAAVARMNPIDIAKLKAAAGAQFAELLAALGEPGASGAGPAVAPENPEPKSEPEPASEPASGIAPTDEMPEPPVALPNAGSDAARVLTSLPTMVAAPLMVAFEDVFGPDAGRLLGDPDFAGDILAGVAGNARRIAECGGDVEDWARHEWSRMRPQILIWMRVRAVR